MQHGKQWEEIHALLNKKLRRNKCLKESTSLTWKNHHRSSPCSSVQVMKATGTAFTWTFNLKTSWIASRYCIPSLNLSHSLHWLVCQEVMGEHTQRWGTRLFCERKEILVHTHPSLKLVTFRVLCTLKARVAHGTCLSDSNCKGMTDQLVKANVSSDQSRFLQSVSVLQKCVTLQQQ